MAEKSARVEARERKALSITFFFLNCGLEVIGVIGVHDGDILGASIVLSIASVVYCLIFAPGWQEDL